VRRHGQNQVDVIRHYDKGEQFEPSFTTDLCDDPKECGGGSPGREQELAPRDIRREK